MDHKINDLAFDTLKQSMGIDSHLGFVEDLLRRHEWDEKKRTEITRSVNNIHNKEQDPNLYLGIIGAFSSGKSTLINALIRDDLLRTDVLPATTASATVICYGTELDVRIKYKDGTLKSFKHVKKEKKNLKAFLHQVTADEEVAKEVEQVTVYNPSEFLKNNLVIVDTPGTDANNERHIQVTGWSIREICDAAIIVIPADRPVSQTLTYFLGKHLSDVLHRCVFVVTKIDLIRHREREVLLKYIESRLKSELKLEQPMVFVSTPLFILDGLTGIEIDEGGSRISREDKQDLINQSLQTEKEIYGILQEQRLLILLERLSNLLSSLFSELQYDLQEMEKGYLARHQALEKNQITDLALYVKQQKDKHHKGIRNQSIDLFENVEEYVGNLKKEVLAVLREAMDGALDDATLRSTVQDGSSYMMQQAEEAIQGMLTEVFEILREISHQQLVEFENDFKVLYKSLATLGGRISVDGPEERNIRASLTFKFENHSIGISELIESDLSDEKWAIGGGLGAGALIGTLIFPGVGTVVGGIIGALLGADSLETTDQLREKYWDKLQNVIDESFYQTKKKTLEILTDAVEKVGKELNRVIDRYFEHYDQLVRQMIARDETEAAELKQRRKIIRADLDQLGSRRQQLVMSQ
uniref:GTPase Era n=1 Tax=Candidatus Methanogaster sp. ANME-2c ERB4 TaxID=2759911 RepID=A0A7G9Y136_9EURY|nr:GTPase Era [Methanosarcinales archaeon ANME-2c ERB4]